MPRENARDVLQESKIWGSSRAEGSLERKGMSPLSEATIAKLQESLCQSEISGPDRSHGGYEMADAARMPAPGAGSEVFGAEFRLSCVKACLVPRRTCLGLEQTSS